jgi:hypothetical protein
MILTTPFGKKEGCDYDQQLLQGGIAGFSPKLSPLTKSIHSCNTSLILRQARPQNIKICAAGFENHSPAFDACLSQTQLNWRNI